MLAAMGNKKWNLMFLILTDKNLQLLAIPLGVKNFEAA